MMYFEILLVILQRRISDWEYSAVDMISITNTHTHTCVYMNKHICLLEAEKITEWVERI